MKRELAFALEARSQFASFVGRTRSSKSPPAQSNNSRRKHKERSSVDRSAKVIDEVHVSRRSKRVKTGIPDGDSVDFDKSKGSEESAAAVAEVAKEKEELAVEAEVASGEGPVAVEVAKGEGEGRRSVEKVYMKRKKIKNQVTYSTPKRFTRSALKEKEENVEELGTPTRKKLELKMSKKIGLGRMPTNMRELLETGLLEGFRVFYNFEHQVRNLQGLIKGIGILCSCNLCEGTKVSDITPNLRHNTYEVYA